MKKLKLVLAVGMIALMQMAFEAVCAFGAGTGDVVIATNEVVNYHLPKNQPSVTFVLTNNAEEPYLWIMARGCDNRKIEYPGMFLKIEVNGTVIGKDRSVLQGETYRMPIHPLDWRRINDKYSSATKAWCFKCDEDFVMNNNCGVVSNRGRYATTDLNYWYAFDLKGLGQPGENRITLTEQMPPNPFKTLNYGGFVVGSLLLGTLEKMKFLVADYERRQIKIDPKELSYEEKVKKEYNLEIPGGRAQKFKVKDGFIHRDGKPFFMAYANPFGAGRDSVLKIYNYYGLINVRMSGVGGRTSQEIFGLPIWLKDGWDKYRPQPVEIAQLLNETRLNYDQGILTLLYCLEPYGISGSYLPDNYPEVVAQAMDGTKPKNEGDLLIPNQAAPLYQEYLRQSHTVLGREFKDHPGVLGASVWEEMGWRAGQGPGKLVPQSAEDLKHYREWLKVKYGTIGRLNEEWGVDYNDFEDVKFPEYKEQTANFVNFQLWRNSETMKCAKIQYEAFKGAAPNQLVMGQKTYGDIGASSGYWKHAIDNWALTEWTDVSREYSSDVSFANLGRASCLAYGGKTMEGYGGIACEFMHLKNTNEWHYLSDQKGKSTYPCFMKIVFNGNKALHWETYDLWYGPYHIIHYNKRWCEEGKTRDGKKTGYDSAGTADVVLEEGAMKSARAQQWVMRNASLVLPASVPKSDVAVLMTTASRMIGHDPKGKLGGTKRLIQSWVDNAGQDFYVLGNLFDNMHLTFDCVEERIIDEIFKYKALIVGYQANVMSRKTAEKIKEYVKKGGTVLFYPEGGTWDSVNFQKDKTVNGISPGFGLSDLFAAKIDNEKIIEHSGIVVKKEISGYKAGETVMTNRYYGVKLESTGGEVIAVNEDGQPVLVKGANGKAWYFGGYLGLTYFQSFSSHERFVQLVEGILKAAGVERRVEIEGMADRRKVVPGLLEGDGYWLVGVNNFDDQGQKLKIKVNGIPDKKYEIVDISGEGFTFEKGKDGNCHMKPDPEGAKAKYVMEKISGTELAKNGFEGNVEKYMSKVWLIRPAGVEVWVNATKEALRSYVELKKPVKIVTGYGNNGDEQKEVEELRKLLTDKGLTVRVVKDNEIKTKVVEGKLVEDGYELEKYRHEVIDDDANLIVIGSSAENSVAKHLETAGNYVFSKVPEMVSEKYPGKGRGIIQLVESINHFSYDATDKAVDAVILAGSDSAGTLSAIQKYIQIIEAK